MSGNNRVAIISMHKLQSQSDYQPKPAFLEPRSQGHKVDDRYRLTTKQDRKERCRYCHELYNPHNNKRGNCLAAPDKMDTYIEMATCTCCLSGLIYHCCADSENEFSKPCSCDTSDETNCRKWTAFVLCSLCFPCMWFYWPLKLCQRMCMRCGCCGGRHKAIRTDTVLDTV